MPDEPHLGGDLIEVVAELGSTNAELSARLGRGELVAEGRWLVADRQTAGRGRQGRAWFDGQGNFMGSTVVHARPGDPSLPSLALLAGLALYDAVSAILPPPARAMLKWPNDLLVGRAKLAGILLERAGDAVVIGIGVNLARAPVVEGRETIALANFVPPPDRDLFAAALATAFSADLARWRGYGLAPVIARWLAAAHPLSTALRVGEPGEPGLAGEFAGLDADGALLLRLSDGTTRTIHAGEVNLARAD